MLWKKIFDFVINKIKSHFFPQEPSYDSQFVTNVLFGSDFLKKKYIHLKRIISENDKILDIMANISQDNTKKLVDPASFTSKIESILSHTLSFIQALNNLTENRYSWLYEVYDRLHKKIMETMLKSIKDPQQSVIFFLNKISREQTHLVGAKASNLAEIKNLLGLNTPEGIVISAEYFKKFLRENKLEGFVKEKLKQLSLKDLKKIKETSYTLTDRILKAKLPQELTQKILENLKLVGKDRWAVRSSAIGEDEEFTFAGQFSSFLNIPTEDVPHTYLKVLASLYQERALFYRLAHNIGDKDLAMAVIVLEMIYPKASGVMYTMDPTDPTSYKILISGVWGLGIPVVSGDVQPDIFVLDKNSGKLIEEKISQKTIGMFPCEYKGVKKKEIDKKLQTLPCLTKKELAQLFEISQTIEEHFKTPQDIEWCIDHNGWVYVLQTRPLKTPKARTLKSKYSSPFLKGEPISPGTCCGPVFWIQTPRDIDKIPVQSIVITPSMNPEFSKILPKIKGLISLKGSTTIHLATVLREFRIPAVVITDLSHKELPDGKTITLDGYEGLIYLGREEEILKGRKKMEFLVKSTAGEESESLKEVLSYILPLTLTDIPEDEEIDPENIKTIHDLIRFIHEISLREMFLWTREDLSNIAHILDSPLVPMIFYIIDLEDGLVPQVAFKRVIKIEHIRSIPFLALWQGMTHPKVRWAGAVPFDFGSFVSIISRSFVRTKEPPGRAYALISRNYLNFHSRLAYHFAAVESFCSDSAASNYVIFKFQGGGANVTGRLRRLTILEKILTHLGFTVSVKADRLNSVIRGTSKEQTKEVLDQLGRLMAYVRQMDMALTSEDLVQKLIDAFLKEDYSIVHG